MFNKTKTLIIFLVLARLINLLLPWLAINLLFPDNPHLGFFSFTQMSWNRWDAPHYIYIAQNWYSNFGDPANFIVFFPLYPLILRVLLIFALDPTLTGIFISIILYLIGAYFFYKLVSLDFSEKIAFWSVISLAIFPTSYFFNSPYTESLFLFLFCGALYSARKEKWVPAGLFSALAVISRPFGILILPAIFVEWIYSKNKKLVDVFILNIPSLVSGLFYLYLNKITYNDFFAFEKILSNHWQKHLSSPITSIMDTWRIALGGGLTNFVLMVGWAEAITITISWLLIPIAFWKLRKSWAVFYTLSIVMFSSTSFILSTPRYLLSIPPFFVLLSLAEKNILFRISWIFISVALLFCLSIIFTRGQWAF